MLWFGSFRLDLADERLWKAGDEVHLRRKPFAILSYLAQHPGRLVTQQELVDAVWGRVATSESLLRTHIRLLRQVVGDGIIETVVGRGYRFVANVEEAEAPSTTRGTPTDIAGEAAPLRSTFLVRRDPDLGTLATAFQRAGAGERQVIFVAGDAGVGKTTLVHAFLERVETLEKGWACYGASVEQSGSGEAYLPIFAALDRACRNAEGVRALDALNQHAPTWLAQMPGLLAQGRAEELQRRVAWTTQARMLRELAQAIEAMSTQRPVVLALDDLQWSDHSTVEALTMIARRLQPARLLILGSYRPAELAKAHPLTKAIGELVAHKQAAELPLEGFCEAGVAEYLERRFPGHAFPASLVPTAWGMTGGNPLFLVTLFDDLENTGTIRLVDGRWLLETGVEEVAARRLDSVRRLIDAQIDRLEPSEQRILEVASVVGNTFVAGVVAHVLDMDADYVDQTCESFATKRRFLTYVGSEEWPDGTIQFRYGFVHTLFQQAAFGRAHSGSIRRWHRRIAECLH